MKYGGEPFDSLSYKYTIFMDLCDRADVPQGALLKAFPTMLKGLALDYYQKLPAQYAAVTAAAVETAAQDHVHPENLIVVAVGDRAKIQSQLEKLNLGPIELRDESGDPVKQ